MHSLLGAVTVDLLLTVLLVLFFVPPFLGWLDARTVDKRYLRFAHIDLREHRTGMGAVVGSALLGTVSHVLIDVLHHPYNPLTFPFPQYYDFNLVLFNDLTISGVIMQGGTLLLLLAMLYFWYLKDIARKHSQGPAGTRG